MNILEDLTSFIKSAKKPLIVIMGPTAAGKTKISLDIARHIDGEIVSTDSRQIYKEMDIATDVLPQKQRKGITHHMLAVKNPDEVLSLAEFKDKALKIIDDIYGRGKIPILVGGTGLYISAITEGYDVPKVPPNEELRQKLHLEAGKYGPEHVHKKLEKLDPEAASRIHPNNLRYVIRAIEIAKAKGRKEDKKAKKSPFDLFTIGITRPREEIYQRINSRVDQQVKIGLLNEVKALLDKGYAPDLPSMTSLGVKEIIPYLKGKKPLEECLETLKKNTRNYAKRQMTWLKRYDNVKWISPDQQNQQK